MDDSRLTKEWIQLAFHEKGSLGELKKLLDLLSTKRTSEFTTLAGMLMDKCRRHSLYELELFVRKVRVQHFLFYADDPGEFVEACLDDVATAHLPQIGDSEMKHCIVDNLLAAFSKMDAHVHAEKIMNLAREQLQFLKPGTKCYSCHENYIIYGLINTKQIEKAQEIVDGSAPPQENITACYDRQKQKVDIFQALGQYETAYQYVKACEAMLQAHEEELSLFRKRKLCYVKATLEARLNRQDQALRTLHQAKESWYDLRWVEYFLESYSILDVATRSRMDPLDHELVEKAYDLCSRRQLYRSAFHINCHLLTIFLSENRGTEAQPIMERFEALAAVGNFRDDDQARIQSFRERMTPSSS